MKSHDVVEVIVSAIQQADELPDEINYVGYEPDIDSEAIKLPMVEVVISSTERIDEHNTDVIGKTTDSAGNETGYVYQRLELVSLQVNMWTAHGSKYDYREMEGIINDELYKYDSAGPGRNLADDVWRVRVYDSEPDEDFGTSPTLRRWSRSLDVWILDNYVEDEDYIEDVQVGGA